MPGGESEPWWVALQRLESELDPPPSGPAAGGARLATVEQVDELHRLIAEIGRHLADRSPAEDVEEWSAELKRAAFGGDEANYVAEGPRTATRPTLGSFDPDEDEDLG